MAVEARRGCGYRKVGGLYLAGEGSGMACCRLPIPLTCCPTCNAGIKQTRGWTWIMPALLGPDRPGCDSRVDPRTLRPLPPCPAARPSALAMPEDAAPTAAGKLGLLWIGERFYKRPSDFIAEGERLGYSRRLAAIPRGFVVGETWVALAHPRTIGPKCAGFACDHAPEDPAHHPSAGVFRLWRPQRIEKIVTPSMFEKEREALAKAGITPVVVPEDDPDHRGTVYDEDREDEEPALPLGDEASDAAGGAA